MPGRRFETHAKKNVLIAGGRKQVIDHFRILVPGTSIAPQQKFFAELFRKAKCICRLNDFSLHVFKNSPGVNILFPYNLKMRVLVLLSMLLALAFSVSLKSKLQSSQCNDADCDRGCHLSSEAQGGECQFEEG